MSRQRGCRFHGNAGRILASRTMRVHVLALLFYLLPAGDFAPSITLSANPSEVVNDDHLPPGNYSIGSGSQYVVQIELATRHVTDVNNLTNRLTSVVGEALNAAAASHFRQKTSESSNPQWSNNITTEILGIESEREQTWISFNTYFNGIPILGEVIAQDMRLLSSSHISATLHYPFSRLLSSKQRTQDAQNRWWIIGLIVAAGFLIVLFGWFILFVYYNSCGRPTLATFNFPKAVYIKDGETQSSFEKESIPVAQMAEKDRSSSSAPSNVQITSSSLEDSLIKEIDDGLAAPRRADKVEDKPPIAMPPRPEKIAPMEAENSKSMSIDSWGIEDEHKKFDLGSNEKKRKERPKTAGKSRPLRTTDGIIMGTVANTTVWNEYAAADVVAKNFGIQPSISWNGPHNHPFPIRPTVGGTLRYEASEPSRSTMNDVL